MSEHMKVGRGKGSSTGISAEVRFTAKASHTYLEDLEDGEEVFLQPVFEIPQ